MMVDQTTNPPSQLQQLAVQLTLSTDRAGSAGAPTELLTQCAVHELRSRAGFTPSPTSNPIPRCPQESRPECSQSAAAILQQLLQPPDADTLIEWCQLADRAGFRVPSRLAPPLLDWWIRQKDRPTAVFNCLGARGPWLSALNPAWAVRQEHDTMSPDTTDLWQSSSTADRLAMLNTVRATKPEQAIGLLQSTWETDNAAERTRFLDALRIGLNLGDEPFLEPLLADRSKTVRRTAAALLRSLPGSTLRSRMNERLRSMLQAETRKGLLKRHTRLTITPPTQFDPAWERDGIEDKPPTGIGQRAWWARQIIAGADLSVWSSATDAAPEAILQAIRDDDFAKDAFESLLLAAQTQSDPAWTMALARAELESNHPRVNLIAPLWQQQPTPIAESILADILLNLPLRSDLKRMILATADWAWSGAFTNTSLQSLLADKPQPGGSFDYATVDALSVISRRADPSALPLFEQLTLACFPDTPDIVARALDRMRLRSEIHKEFRL